MKFIKLMKQIKSAEQPTSPKPTAQLPQNMEYAWDPKANQWIAVMKDNPSVTPPTYNPNQTNMYSTTTTGMTPIKSSLVECLNNFIDGERYSKEIKIEAGLIKGGLLKYAGFDFNRGTKYAITTKGLELLRRASEAEYNEVLNEREKSAYMFGFNTDEISTLDTTGKVIKSEEVTDEQLEESWNKYYPLYRKDMEEEKITEENYPANDEVAQKLKTTLSMYLYGLKRYRKAIPIMKYHTNAKMKRVVEDGRSKGLSEDEITKQVDAIAEEYYKKENKIKPTFNSLSEDYLKSFLFGMIKNNKTASLNEFTKQWNICEADGSELGKVTASSELDAKIKFTLQHPEYKDSLSIRAKEIKANKIFFVEYSYPASTEDAWYITTDKVEANTEEEALQIAKEKLVGADNFHIVNKGFSNSILITKDSNPKYFHKNWGYDGEKLINEDTEFDVDANYSETTDKALFYPNPSISPSTDIELENHDGWVNTASTELLDLHNILTHLKMNELADVEIGNDKVEIYSTPELINTLEHQIKDSGLHCQVTEESKNNPKWDWKLTVFLK